MWTNKIKMMNTKRASKNNNKKKKQKVEEEETRNEWRTRNETY